MLRYLSWGNTLSDLLLSVLAIFVSTLLVWWFVACQAKRVRQRFDALLSMAHQSDDAEHEIAVTRRRLTTLRLVVNAARYALVIGALLMILRRVGVPLDSLLLPAGFIGAALGLGAQNLVRDIVAGLFIVFEGQLAVGDVVAVDGKNGTVQEVGLRVTHLRDDRGHDLYFPNGTINVVDKQPRRAVAQMVRVPVADATKTDEARRLLALALEEFDRDYKVFENTVAGNSASNSNVKGENGLNMEANAHRVLDVPEQSAGNAIYIRLLVRPERAPIVQTKLAPRLVSILEAHGIQKGAGTEVEIFDAPAP